jgi:4-carboxymuconolactone decarboxylase
MKTSIVLAGVVALLAAGLLFEASKARAQASENSRFSQLTIEELSGEQRVLAEQILKVSSVGLSGPYNALLRSPVMGERMFSLLDYLRFNTSVPRRLNEFAILIQARRWTSQVEWKAHYPLALRAGLSQSVADDLKQGKRPASMKPDEAAVYDFCTELAGQNGVSDATFKRLRSIFSEQQVVDLVILSGTYDTLAMLLNAVDETGVPPGQAPPLQLLAHSMR